MTPCVQTGLFIIRSFATISGLTLINNGADL